jgi:hypothetical protein
LSHMNSINTFKPIPVKSTWLLSPFMPRSSILSPSPYSNDHKCRHNDNYGPYEISDSHNVTYVDSCLLECSAVLSGRSVYWHVWGNCCLHHQEDHLLDISENSHLQSGMWTYLSCRQQTMSGEYSTSKWFRALSLDPTKQKSFSWSYQTEVISSDYCFYVQKNENKT